MGGEGGMASAADEAGMEGHGMIMLMETDDDDDRV